MMVRLGPHYSYSARGATETPTDQPVTPTPPSSCFDVSQNLFDIQPHGPLDTAQQPSKARDRRLRPDPNRLEVLGPDDTDQPVRVLEQREADLDCVRPVTRNSANGLRRRTLNAFGLIAKEIQECRDG